MYCQKEIVARRCPLVPGSQTLKVKEPSRHPSSARHYVERRLLENHVRAGRLPPGGLDASDYDYTRQVTRSGDHRGAGVSFGDSYGWETG